MLSCRSAVGLGKSPVLTILNADGLCILYPAFIKLTSAYVFTDLSFRFNGLYMKLNRGEGLAVP